MNAPPAAREASINVTPLVDVCLVLLIIFMAVIQAQLGYTAALARESDSREPAPVEPAIVVSLKQNGVFLNQEAVEPGSLASRLKPILAGRHDPVVFFSSDDGVSYEKAMSVIDQINRTGARIGIGTEK